jgi:hypothetical protein
MEAHKDGGEPFVVSEPSKTWIDRMWHAALAAEGDAADYEQMDDLFSAYVETLDEHERNLTMAAHLFLSDMLLEGWDNWPRCVDCGARLWPHCGERYRERAH